MTEIGGPNSTVISVKAQYLHADTRGFPDIEVAIWGRDQPTARITLDSTLQRRLIQAIEKERERK